MTRRGVARRGRVIQMSPRRARWSARGWAASAGWRRVVRRLRGVVAAWWPAGAIGQSLVEYALILLFIAVAVVGAVTLFGDTLGSTYGRVTSSFIMINR